MAAPASIGMAVPGATDLMGGGPSLAEQVKNETEEQRKKRLRNMQAAQSQPGASAILGTGYGAALGG